MAMTAKELAEAIQEYIDDKNSGGVWVDYGDNILNERASDAGLPDEMMKAREDKGVLILSP